MPPIYTTQPGEATLPDSKSERENSELKLVEDLHAEGLQLRTHRGSGGFTLEEVWERNGQLYMGDHWATTPRAGSVQTEGDQVRRHDTAAGITKFTINRIQQAIIAQRAVAFGRPEQFRFEPMETMGDPVVFIKPEMGQSLLQAIQSGEIPLEGSGLEGFSEGQLTGTEPIPELFVRNLLESGFLEEDSFFRITDDTVARAVQKVWDVLYRRSGAPAAVATNELYSSIFGHQPLLFQWDTSSHTFKFTNPHILNVVIDPDAEGTEDADYLVLNVLISADQAKAIWPGISDDIDRAADQGQLNDIKAFSVSNTGKVPYRRSMVVVRIAWVRHQQVPTPLRKAIRTRAVVLAEPKAEEEGRGEFTEIVDVEGFEVGEDGRPIVIGPDGARRPARFVKRETGGTTRPGWENWPTEPGIRQIHTLPQIGRVIQSLRCPYADIPVGWNKNIPVPYSPYGQGEPERLEDLQQAINRLFTILHRHAKYYQAPMEFWPEDLYTDVVEKGFQPYSKPGRIIPVRQDIYQLMVQMGGSSGFGVVNQIPPIPSFYVQLLTILLQEFDRLSGFTDVLQGAPPGPETSGRAIEALQSAARGPIGVKTKFTEWMLEYLGRIGLDALRKWLPESVWASVLDQYPLPVLRFIRSRIEETDFDVTVSLVSGRGANRQADFERVEALYMGGDPARLMDRRTAMELADVPDVDATIRRIERENREGFAGLEAPQGSSGEAGQEPGGGSGSGGSESQQPRQ